MSSSKLIKEPTMSLLDLRFSALVDSKRRDLRILQIIVEIITLIKIKKKRNVVTLGTDKVTNRLMLRIASIYSLTLVFLL